MKHKILCGFFLSIFLGSYAQENEDVDFKHLDADVKILPSEMKITGKVRFEFEVLEETDSVFVDAQKMEVEGVRLNDRAVQFKNDGQRLWIISDLTRSKSNILEFSYTAAPQQTIYFIGWDNPEGSEYKPQVWTQGQGKYTSHWLPSFDDATEKLEFDLSFTFPKGMEVVSNGKLVDRQTVSDSFTRWEYDMLHPMSSYLVAVAAGQYYKEEMTSSSGIPIALYFYPGEEEKVEPTYRYTQEIFDFLEAEIGVAYPWQNYKQVPVRDFLYSGMENTTATIFSDIFVVDSIGFIDRNYVMVNAHELAHQWFGDLVTAESGEDHWLQEGFATYYALLAEREVFGEDHYYWRLFEIAEQLKELSDKGEGEAIMDMKASSLTFYQKGAWALHILRERIGDEAFQKGVRSYLEKYAFKSVSVEDLIDELEKTSGRDLSGFIDEWLKQTAFPATEALNSLQKSEFIQSYLSLAALKETALEKKKEQLQRALDFPVNHYLGQEVVYQLALEDPYEAADLYRKALATNDLLVRQTVALTMETIPQVLRGDYENLLSDDSYLTKEAALYNLWMNFPEERRRYLDQLKRVEGLSDKNIRILWLALNLATPEFEESKQAEVYQEFSNYTSPQYPFLIRQNALKYLYQLNSFSNDNLKDIMQGTQHHVSRFRSFSRDLLKRLIENESYRLKFNSLSSELPENQQEYLKRLLQQ